MTLLSPFKQRRRGEGGFNFIPIVLGLAAALFFVVKGCQEGPFGRRQIVAINPAQESALGAQAFNDVLSKSAVVPRDEPISIAVDRLAKQLIKPATDPEILNKLRLKKPDFAWETRVVRSKEINAFCLPGGKIVVYTGIIPVARTESQLAAVMGHEIAHALAHHGAERMAQQQIVQIGQVAAAASISQMDSKQQTMILMAINAGSQFGILLPYSRSHESEADHLGLILMAAAGHDPRKAVTFWKSMAKATSGGQRPPEFMSTHPGTETRIRDLEKWMPEAMGYYERIPEKERHADKLLPGVP